MVSVFYIEKKQGYNIEAISLFQELKENLLIEKLEGIRVLNKYIINGASLKDIELILHESTVDNIYNEEFPLKENESAFAVEYLPGQYDQRANWTEECYNILNLGEKIQVRSSKVMVIQGNLTLDDLSKVKKYCINPVDSREIDPYSRDFYIDFSIPKKVEILHNFIELDSNSLKNFHEENRFAMSFNDMKMIQAYFKEENRNPYITEIKVIDTYWSDHCRHTTFQTSITEIEIEEGELNNSLKESLSFYKNSREFVYKNEKRDITLMDIAIICMKEMKKRGTLEDLDISDEINACSINVNIETTDGFKDYLIMFKNETHNHPTEIEPFGGAATCLGGAIRDPLSGRTYVYQAMRVTGCSDPTESFEETLKGKLSQRKITLGAAHGYSSYGNQIGLCTGEVREFYHPGYVAKRMEIGAVIGAAPKENIIRNKPETGDVIILLGGKTGRDGCGGATGSSKEHTIESIEECGAEVQKGNPPTERKIQRLFRNKKVTKLIKKCNDFGAGGVSVAIGELCDSLDINLDLIPKKYEGLDGTELAISESQERMAVVIRKEYESEFISLAENENLEATKVATVTDTGYLRMFWNGEKIVNLKREFLNTNGAKQYINVSVKAPLEKENYFKNYGNEINIKDKFINTLKNLNIASQKGLVERFDSTIGAGTILMPFGGKYRLTPTEGMVSKIPVLNGESLDVTIMTNGFNPYLSTWSPYHGAYYSIIEAVTKVVTIGGNFENIRLTLQEYFEKLYKDPFRWGKPFSALLGAYRAQMDLNIPAIGGKDSMSGSFGDMDVPPSLVSFAVSVEKASNIISPEFKYTNSKIIYIKVNRNNEEMINIKQFKNNMKLISKLIKEKKILSAYSIKTGGLCEAISKMCFGNKIGCKLNKNVNEELMFAPNYGSIVVEVSKNIEIEEAFKNSNYIIVGETNNTSSIEVLGESFNLDNLIDNWEEKLDSVFKIKTKTNNINEIAKEFPFENKYKVLPSIKLAKPKIIIPVFPGTNCEYDSEAAFNKAGGECETLVFKNLSYLNFKESINELEKNIRKSQIIMIPGGFSAGDEPDGSGKFIATVFRNEKIKDAVMDLIKNRDGLILGICNGFQALIKLGLVPYGEIVDIEEDMATLTYNNINRHMSAIVSTKITSKLSPWLNGVEIGDIHEIPISHGEGKFIAPEHLIQKLLKNGQIATQYVDTKGNISLNMPYNPNGSLMGIEGITSPDGRIFGKMGHSERIGKNLYKNIPGNFDQKIFESGIKYFK